MSETREPAGTANPTAGHTESNYTTPLAPTSSGLLRLGGALGIAACAVGLLIFVVGCAGLGKAVVLSIVPVGLSIAGLAVSLFGAVTQKHLITEDTHVLQALFVNIAGLIGGFLLMAVWRGWPIFYA
jgi:hypothetical protein